MRSVAMINVIVSHQRCPVPQTSIMQGPVADMSQQNAAATRHVESAAGLGCYNNWSDQSFIIYASTGRRTLFVLTLLKSWFQHLHHGRVSLDHLRTLWPT